MHTSAVRADAAPRIEVMDRDGTPYTGTLIAQTATGWVRIKWDADDSDELLELENLEYRWLPEGLAPRGHIYACVEQNGGPSPNDSPPKVRYIYIK